MCENCLTYQVLKTLSDCIGEGSEFIPYEDSFVGSGCLHYMLERNLTLHSFYDLK